MARVMDAGQAITEARWKAARAALRDSAGRFAALARSCDPRAMATEDWSVADTVAHVTAVALWDTALAQAGDVPLPYPWDQFTGQIRATTVDNVDVINDRTMELFTERDPQVLAGQLLAHVDSILESSENLSPDTPADWFGGAHVPLAGLFAHLINELEIHGRDMALATGTSWVIPPEHAGMFQDLFVAGIVRHGVGRFLTRAGYRPARRRVVVRFRSRHAAPMTLALDPSGAVRHAAPGTPVDVRVFYDPAALNLMVFGRLTPLRAALAGKVLVGGRRPWLLPAFLRVVRFPS